MTTHTGTNTPVTTAARRPPQWLRSAKWLLGVQGWVMGWFVVIGLLSTAVIVSIIARYTDLRLSAVSMGQHAGIWIPFSISIILIATHLTVHVAAGMTRRSFSIGALITAVLTGLGYAVMFTVLLVGERWLYGEFGWRHGSASHEGLVFDPGALTVAGGLALLFTAGAISGLLVGILYYRLGGWYGTLTLPVGLAPLVVVTLLSLDPETQFTPWDVPLLLNPSARPVLGLATLVLAAGLFHLIIRRTPIAAKEA